MNCRKNPHLLLTLVSTGLAIIALDVTADASLINHYKFDGDAKDSVNGFDGTVVGATLTTDRFGNANRAYSFDGVNDYIDIGNPKLTNFTDDFSFTAWINPDSSNTQTWPTIISKWSGGTSPVYYETFWFGLRRNGDGLGGEVTDSLGNHYKDDAVNVNTWQHVAMTYDKSAQTMALYVDGSLLESWSGYGGGTLSNDNSQNILIGAVDRNSLSHVFKGAIDDVRIYSGVLTPDDVNGLAIPEPSTLIIWSMLGALAVAIGWRRKQQAS